MLHPHFAQYDFPWEDCHGEPNILPDTGAKDGLCGEAWAVNAGRWALAHGHKSKVETLPQTRQVSGVGKGSQIVDEKITV